MWSNCDHILTNSWLVFWRFWLCAGRLLAAEASQINYFCLIDLCCLDLIDTRWHYIGVFCLIRRVRVLSLLLSRVFLHVFSTDLFVRHFEFLDITFLWEIFHVISVLWEFIIFQPNRTAHLISILYHTLFKLFSALCVFSQTFIRSKGTLPLS